MIFIADLLPVHQIISADGLECAPTDLLTWALVKYVNDKFSVHTKEVISSIYQLK